MHLLTAERLYLLHDAKVLLAFSGGADSTALFFSLIQNNITFDIAIVHYGQRTQADEEISYAQELAKKYDLNCHLLKAKNITQNFEHNARKIRYDFFEDLIKEHHYKFLLTAHHLQDRLEWLLMQLCKGAGSTELIGMQERESRQSHTLLRPFIELTKEDIHAFLKEHEIKWFDDESNDDPRYKRNYFRHEIATELIHKYSSGIRQSFQYLQEDADELIHKVTIQESYELSLFTSTGHKRSDIYHIDKILKSKGYMLSASQRESLKEQDELIVGRKFLIIFHENTYFIAPYMNTTMIKSFKEECRKLSIPTKLRPYLFTQPSAFDLFKRSLA